MLQSMRYATVLALFSMVFLFATPASAQQRGEAWKDLQAGDRAELDVACSNHWEPVTISKVEPVPGRTDRDYTVKRQDGSTWSFRAPGIVAPCGRTAGSAARERAALPNLPTGVYGCIYRGTPMPAMEFALLAGTTYRDRDGGRGNYQLDPKTHVLAFTSGPMRGMRAQQIGSSAVQMLRDDGTPTGNVCSHNPKRDANAPKL